MLSKLTLMGLHNYSDGKLWDDLTLPEGLDKDAFINEVLRQGAEFPLLYPDYDYMKYQVKAFSTKWQKTFEKWLAMYNAEYEPLFNVDVKTTTTEDVYDEDNELKHEGLRRDVHNDASSQARNDSKNQLNKAAYDASNFQPVESTSISGLNSLSSSEFASESESHSESNSHSYEHSMTMEEYKRGNQGITMSQEMWLAETNMWYWNIYQHMAEIFVTEYCICLYA